MSTSDAENTTHWSIGLGPYDDEAVHTLPAQLDLLRTLGDAGGAGLELVLRVETVRPRGAELQARGRIVCTSPPQAKLDPKLLQSLDDFASVGLIDGYHLYHGRETATIHRYSYALAPQVPSAAALPLKRDWSPLFDLLRKQRQPIAVDISVSVPDVSTQGQHMARIGVPLNGPLVIEASNASDPGIPAFAAMSANPSNVLLELRLTATSDRPISKGLLSIVGRLVLGVNVEVVALDSKDIRARHKFTPVVGPPEAVIRAWHAPYGKIQGRGSLGKRATDIAIRESPRKINGTAIGTATFHGARYDEDVAVTLSPKDRLRHVYVIGKTGSGKTNLLKNMAASDIGHGYGVAIISPHPDLPEFVLDACKKRPGEVTFLDFSNPEEVPILNPLTLDVENAHDYQMAVEEVIEIIVRRSYNQFTGPVFEDTVRMILESARHIELNGVRSIPSIPLALELLRTPRMRKWTANHLRAKEPDLADLWDTFGDSLSTTIAETARWTLAKFVDFGVNGSLRTLTTQASDLSVKRIFDQRGVLVVSLPETGMGSNAVEFVGAVIFARLYAAAKASPARGRPFMIHVDEFQRFVSHELESLVAEARKFNLGLTFAHQNLRQLEAFSRFEGASSSRLGETIFSNVGTMIAMKMAGRDVEVVADELELPPRSVREIGQYQAVARCVIDGNEAGPFTLRMPLAAPSPEHARAVTTARRDAKRRGLTKGKHVLEDAIDKEISLLKLAAVPPAKSSFGGREGAKKDPTPPPKREGAGKTFLDEWLEKRMTDASVEDESSRPTQPDAASAPTQDDNESDSDDKR